MEDKKLNIYQKLAKARVEVLNSSMKKSGKNSFAKFNYYELSDIIPTALPIFEKLGLLTQFNINEKTATITVYNCDVPSEKLTFSTNVAEDVSQIKNPIQTLGSKHTYLKRYLYLNVLDLVEYDTIDATTGMTVNNQNQAKQQSVKVDVNLKKEQDNLKKLLNDNNLNLIEYFSKYKITKTSTVEELKKAYTSIIEELAESEVSKVD